MVLICEFVVAGAQELKSFDEEPDRETNPGGELEEWDPYQVAEYSDSKPR
jgi:hypothetical protein